jgi:hypothetical protein
MDIERLKSAIERVKNAWKREYKTSEVIEARDILIDLAQQVIDGTIVECPCIKCSMDVKAKRNWACKACAISCPKDKLPSQKMMSEEIDIEDICEKVHKAYCKYHLEHKGEEYWTKGDYSKLTEEGKEYDRRTVRAVLEAIGIGTFQEEGGQI